MNYDANQQLLLGLVLAVMIFGVSLELRVQQLMAIARQPQPILAGMLGQCLILPWTTLLVDLHPGLELGLLLLLGLPLVLGMLVGNAAPQFAERIMPWFKRFSLLAFALLVIGGVLANWRMLSANLGLVFLVVVLHNVSAILLALVAALWGTWHLISGLLLVLFWRNKALLAQEEIPCVS